MTEFKLAPCGIQKSFYGKAHVVNDGRFMYLKSYGTFVLRFDPQTGELARLWHGYSDTTMRHVNAFCRLFNLSGICKREWLAM